MNCIWWTIVAILCQAVFAVGIASVIRQRFSIGVRYFTLFAGVMLFAITVYWYVNGWMNGEWLLIGKNKVDTIFITILGHIAVSGVMAAMSWSMFAGTVMATSCRVDEAGMIRPHPRSLVAWVIKTFKLKHPNICTLSWIIGGAPVLAVWIGLVAVWYLAIAAILSVVFFILFGVKPWLTWLEMATSKNYSPEVLRIGKVPIIPSIPIIIGLAIWMFTAIPLLHILNTLLWIVLSVVAIAAFVVGAVYAARWIIELRKKARRRSLMEPQSAPTSGARLVIHRTIERVKEAHYESLWLVIGRFFRWIGEKIDAAWDFTWGLKNKACPLVVPDEIAN